MALVRVHGTVDLDGIQVESSVMVGSRPIRIADLKALGLTVEVLSIET